MTDTFPIVPAQVRAAWFMIPTAVGVLLLLGGAVLVGVLGTRAFSGAQAARFEVSPAGLRLRGDAYGRLIPAAALRTTEARAVDLRTERALAPRLRTMGTALPGYQAGWFRLRNGQKALVYLTDPTHVAYVPTTRGYVVLLSVADPAALITSLRRAAGTAGSDPPHAKA